MTDITLPPIVKALIAMTDITLRPIVKALITKNYALMI